VSYRTGYKRGSIIVKPSQNPFPFTAVIINQRKNQRGERVGLRRPPSELNILKAKGAKRGYRTTKLAQTALNSDPGNSYSAATGGPDCVSLGQIRRGRGVSEGDITGEHPHSMSSCSTAMKGKRHPQKGRSRERGTQPNPIQVQQPSAARQHYTPGPSPLSRFPFLLQYPGKDTLHEKEGKESTTTKLRPQT